MTNVYSQQDYTQALSQKRRCLTYFFIVTGIYAVATVGIFVYFLLEPYGTAKEPWLLTAECVLSGLYAIFAYIYLMIRFGKIRRYCIFLDRVLNRKASSGTASFLRFNSDLDIREGVDFRSMTLAEWSDKEKDYMDRYIYLDVEKPRPDFRAGDEISFLTYANVLVGYSINNRTSLIGTPFEEK